MSDGPRSPALAAGCSAAARESLTGPAARGQVVGERGDLTAVTAVQGAAQDGDAEGAADFAGEVVDCRGAQYTLGYARDAHARRGHLADTAGAIATAACQAAHSVLAARGQWVTNEKNLPERAGLRGIDDVLAGLTAGPGHLLTAVAAAGTLLQAAAGEPAGS